VRGGALNVHVTPPLWLRYGTMHRVDQHTKSYVCTHVFSGERPVLYVTRPDGDWCLLCGDEHPQEGAAYRVVGIGHLLDGDDSLRAILDLGPNQEAERDAVGAPWSRTAF
jgi:hypothetical protein